VNGLAKAHNDARVLIRRKAWLFHSYLIRAHSKLLRPKKALLIGCYRARLTRGAIPHRNFRACYRGPAAVPDRPFKNRCDSRNLGGSVSRAKQNGKQYQNHHRKMAHRDQTSIRNHLAHPFGPMFEEQRTTLDSTQ